MSEILISVIRASDIIYSIHFINNSIRLNQRFELLMSAIRSNEIRLNDV